MVRAGSLASGGDFLLRLAGCQGKDLIPQRRRAALAASRFSSCGALAPAWSRWSGGFLSRGRGVGCGSPSCRRGFAVARKHTLGRFQLAELAGELVALCTNRSKSLAETLLPPS